MGGICRVYIYCIPDFTVVVFQYLLYSIDGGFIVSDGIFVSRNSFGQVVRVGLTQRDTWRFGFLVLPLRLNECDAVQILTNVLSVGLVCFCSRVFV